MKEEMPCFCKMIIPNPTIVHSSMCLWKLAKDEKKKKPTAISSVEVKIEIEWVGHGDNETGWTDTGNAMNRKLTNFLRPLFEEAIEDGTNLMEISGIFHNAVDDIRTIVSLEHRFKFKVEYDK